MTELFNATYYSENLDSPDIVKNPAYISHDADETVRIGRAFADAVRGMRGLSRRVGAPIRIGIVAPSGTGKSTFIRGILAGLDGYSTVEINTDFRLQQTFQNTNRVKGWLRHYDASLDDNYGLPSYLADDISEFGIPFVDIVEHPGYDVNDKNCHCLIFMEKQMREKPPSRRALRFLTGVGIEHSEGFRMFTRKAEPFMERPALLPPPNRKP